MCSCLENSDSNSRYNIKSENLVPVILSKDIFLGFFKKYTNQHVIMYYFLKIKQ